MRGISLFRNGETVFKTVIKTKVQNYISSTSCKFVEGIEHQYYVKLTEIHDIQTNYKYA